MRYRIHGRDEASQSPVEPYYLKAADEEEARSRAVESGTVVERVEAVPQEAEAIQAFPERAPPPLILAPFPVAEHSSLSRVTQPRPRTGWLLVCLVLVPVSVAAGVGIGIMLPRAARPGPAKGAPAPLSPGAPLLGIRVEHVTAAEDIFNMAGQRAVVLKYSGGDVDCWVEIDSQRGKQKVAGFRMAFGAGESDLKQPGSDQTIEGYFVWLRGEDNDDRSPGNERWTVAYRRGLATTKASAIDVGNPTAHVNFVQSLKDTSGWSMSHGVQVWRGKPAGAVMTFSSNHGAIPSPFPVGQEVCVQEFRAERKQDKSEIPSAIASMLGMLASQHGPLLAVSAFSTEKQTIDVHTIRVMCQAANRYQSACLTMRAGAGKPEQDKARLRAQALDWLRADLDLSAKEFQTGKADAVLGLHRQLPRWQTDPDLASVRDANAVATLPEKEQAEWRKLWTSVEELLKEVRAAITTEAENPGTLTEQDPQYTYQSPFSNLHRTTSFKAYELKMKAGRLYVIDMVAAKTPDNKLDPYLYLEDQTKKIVAQDDDSGGFPNARITYRASADGAYRIIASGFSNDRNFGAYTLTIRSVKDGK
jgi:hypothetical protein